MGLLWNLWFIIQEPKKLIRSGWALIVWAEHQLDGSNLARWHHFTCPGNCLFLTGVGVQNTWLVNCLPPHLKSFLPFCWVTRDSQDTSMPVPGTGVTHVLSKRWELLTIPSASLMNYEITQERGCLPPERTVSGTDSLGNPWAPPKSYSEWSYYKSDLRTPWMVRMHGFEVLFNRENVSTVLSIMPGTQQMFNKL